MLHRQPSFRRATTAQGPLVSELHSRVVEQAARSLPIPWPDGPPRLDGCYFDVLPAPSIRPIPIFPDLMEEMCHYWAHPFLSIETILPFLQHTVHVLYVQAGQCLLYSQSVSMAAISPSGL